MNESIWSHEVEIDSFPKLNSSIRTSILVIGGGITGILCAYELQKKNYKVVLVEQDHIGKGITKNTTAFITAHHDLLYQDIINKFSVDKARTYLQLNTDAISYYKKLGEIYDIDYKECSAILFTSKDNHKIYKEKYVLDHFNYPCEIVSSLPIDNIDITIGIKFINQGQLNPLKVIKELSKELTIYENTRIENIKGNRAYTKDHHIEFSKVIITTHYPLINRYGLYFTKLYQRRSYVCALKYPSIEDTYCSIDEDGLYFRSYQDYLIIGGNDRDTKNPCTSSFVERIVSLFPDCEIKYSWSNQDLITIDNLPYIGRYDRFHTSWYVATGFNLWGFTWAAISAKIITDMIEGGQRVDLVDPGRNFIKKQLFLNLGNVLKNMLSFQIPRCTHMGVKMKYNRIDKTFECPAHGTRFNQLGEVINGPAKKDSKSKIFDK
ncbi:MAG: FAD-dependent oxidoreductase [Bacilli bacterium]|nr:FAD-dependent oxidoreductase [Bacillales bacterium]MDY2574918.1 FAD-dependent oxidoreductase [Bacilli bacterium]